MTSAGNSTPPALVMPSHASGATQACARPSARAGICSRQPDGASGQPPASGLVSVSGPKSLSAVARKAAVRPSMWASNWETERPSHGVGRAR